MKKKTTKKAKPQPPPQVYLTLREWYAGQALQGLVTGALMRSPTTGGGLLVHESVVPTAYALADMMLKGMGRANY